MAYLTYALCLFLKLKNKMFLLKKARNGQEPEKWSSFWFLVRTDHEPSQTFSLIELVRFVRFVMCKDGLPVG